ncbi:hypothetical protein F5Y03DRAFT_361388 [Xylaria venustula]|nr:hypothetical protein F5Y03DRAFT_361388 [Xylaria venustula]
MALSEHNIISIVQIIFFIPALAIALLLGKRHGFGRNAGWLLMIIFSLIRIIGASLQLAATAQPDNLGLYFGALTLQGVGLSPFIVVMLAFINRALSATSQASTVIINPATLRLASLLVIVSVALGIYGGTSAGDNYAETGVYKVSTYSEAATILVIIGFVIVVLATILLGFNISHVEPGEKRVVLTVALSLPFLLVRVIYQAVGTFQPHSAFSSVTGNINVLIGAAIVEEFIITLIVEGLGLTFNVRPKSDAPSGSIFSRLFSRLQQCRGGYQAQSWAGHDGDEMQNLNRRSRRNERRAMRSSNQRYESYRQHGMNQSSGEYDGYNQRLSQSPPQYEGAHLHSGVTNV